MDIVDIKSLNEAAERYEHRKTPTAREIADRKMVRLQSKGFTVQVGEALMASSQMGGAQSLNLFERILNTNDLRPVSFFHKGHQTARAVGRIVLRNRSGAVLGYGTGFRVSPRLVLTNNHVLKDADAAACSYMQFDYSFGLDGKPMQELNVSFAPATFFHTNAALDFSLVALDDPGAEKTRDRLWLRFIRESGKALAGEWLNIIQHPRGDRQMIAFRNNRAHEPSDDYQHYDTDTEPGSSGSPVLNDAWELAALHHSSVPKRDPKTKAILKLDGKPYRKGEDPNLVAWIANEGIRVSRIVAALDKAGLVESQRGLYAQCFEEPPALSGASGAETALDSLIGGSNANPGFHPAGTDAQGRAIWHFALTFGPAGLAPATSAVRPAAAAPTPAAPAVLASPPRPDARATSGPKLADADFERAAQKILEEKAGTGPYLPQNRIDSDSTAYYKGIRRQGAGVREALTERLTETHTPLNNYNKARLDYLYPRVDRHRDKFLRSVYSGRKVAAEKVIAEELKAIAEVDMELAVMLIEGRFEEATQRELAYGGDFESLMVEKAGGTKAKGFNCEHVVPQSWFEKAEPMRSDLHHLFTCEDDCNSYRGNIPYFDFEDFEPEPTPDEAMRALCGLRQTADDGNGAGFEPEFGKGAVARATLYFLIRYPDGIDEARLETVKSRLNVLIDWHEAFPPDAWEKHRNQAIFEIQGNRNPLVDLPNIGRKLEF